MTSITSRALRLLRLFSTERPLWTVEQVASALGVSTSTAYRYIQDLLASGFLDPVQGGYVLGPALIELDYLVRQHDPLIQAAAPYMRDLLHQTTQRGAVILCRRFRDRVMCIHQEHGSEPHHAGGYQRGVGMPLFVGATSRVILANEASRIQKRIYLENETEIRSSGLTGWKDFSKLTASVRRDGYAETASEVTAGIRGIAVPIFRGAQLAAAMSLVVETTIAGPQTVADWRAAIISAARELSANLRETPLAIGR